MCAVGQNDEAFDRLTLLGDGIDDRRKRHVEKHVLGLGVVQHPGDLIGREARIDGVDDRADAGNGIVKLQMPVRIPGDRGDTVARLHFQRPGQHVGKAFGPRMAVLPAIAVDLPRIGQAADDFAAPVIVGRMLENARNHQLAIHHLSTQTWRLSSRSKASGPL